jgi:hypothetical protein
MNDINKKSIKSVNKSVEDKRVHQIAFRIKELRKKSGFSSYEDFAWEHNFKRAQYWRLEKGANFTIVTLLKVLDAHKISLEEFFKGL